jgi:hypothetical protein
LNYQFRNYIESIEISKEQAQEIIKSLFLIEVENTDTFATYLKKEGLKAYKSRFV